MFVPKLFTTLKTYTLRDFGSDLIAGLVVGVVALPLAIAFGIASGVSPEKGLITAIIGGFLVSALGGSRVQIGGPTGAFVVIVYGIIHQYGLSGLVTATLMAGVLLIVMGIARMGDVIKFIPRPVVVGFTSGIALIIFSAQVKEMLGLRIPQVPPDFVGQWRVYLGSTGPVNPVAAAIAGGTVLTVVLWNRFWYKLRVPGSLVAIIAASAAAGWLNLPVETIAGRFGELPHTLPSPVWPRTDLKTLQELISPAFTIAILAGVESLLSAVVADGMIGARHRSNMELVAQGVANIGSALFGGIPATGAIARTATNVKNGARTPVAGIVHALTLLAIVFFFGPLAGHIPLACLAGILVVVAYHMSEWRSFAMLLKGPRSDVVVLLVTFFLTVFFDLTLAIEVGMVLSAFLFMRRMTMVAGVQILHSESEDEARDRGASVRMRVPEGVEVYEIEGPFFFGVSQQFEETMRVVSKRPKVRILVLEDVPFIDATGLHVLRQFHAMCRKGHATLLLAAVRPRSLGTLRQAGFEKELGPGNILPNLGKAIARAEDLLKK